MNKRIKPNMPNQTGIALALLALLAMLPPGTAAKDKPSDYDLQRVSVIAHMPVPGAAVNQMFVQAQGNKQYLYIQQVSKPGYTIVDVSKANKPKVIKSGAFPDSGSKEKVQMVGGGIALSETPESAGGGSTVHELAPARAPSPTTAARTTQSVRVLDMSDPANPRTLQTFDGVTSVLADDSRSLIYIANGDGLWVLRHRQVRAPLPQCDSESVFSPIADCQ